MCFTETQVCVCQGSKTSEICTWKVEKTMTFDQEKKQKNNKNPSPLSLAVTVEPTSLSESNRSPAVSIIMKPSHNKRRG